MLDNEIFDYSKTDISKGAGISRTTLAAAWPKLEMAGLVIPTREVGRAKMYKLDIENPIVEKLFKLDDAVSNYFAPSSCDPSPSEEVISELKVMPIYS